MAMTMMEFLERENKLFEEADKMFEDKLNGPKIFGQIMHDDTWTDDEKKRVLAKLEEMGGYECLGE